MSEPNSRDPGEAGPRPARALVRTRLVRTLIALALLASIGIVYAPVSGHEFLNYDDDTYVTENRRVQQGLSEPSLRWALGSFHGSNWHPVTWLSHMLDWELFGDWAGGHHLSNVAIHGLGAVALFLFLAGATGRVGRSALVAAWFALHPLHVESVAWIAERKDVLSALFGWLSLAAWVRYARAAKPVWYAATLVLFILALASKPMWVTLPGVLLLLDVWPLGRLSGPAAVGLRRLVVEKLPLVGIAAASSVVTLLAQRTGTAITPLESLPLLARLGNAVLSYGVYLVQAWWPVGLAIHYPHPGDELPWLAALAALAGIVGISLAVLWAWRFRARGFSGPLVLGWGWYLVTLVPVIGIVQVGLQGHADRYTYVPLVGVFIAVVFGLGDVIERRGSPRLARSALALALACTLAMAAASRHQLRHWRDSVALWQRAIAVAESPRAHNMLGVAQLGAGQAEEALASFQRALRLDPDRARTWNNLGGAHERLGRTDVAIEHYRRALALRPADAQAWNNLGVALGRQGRYDEARQSFERALSLRRDYGVAWQNLAMAHAALGNPAAAAQARARAQGATRGPVPGPGPGP